MQRVRFADYDTNFQENAVLLMLNFAAYALPSSPITLAVTRSNGAVAVNAAPSNLEALNTQSLPVEMAHGDFSEDEDSFSQSNNAESLCLTLFEVR